MLLLGAPIVATLAWYHGHRGRQKVTASEFMIIALLLAFADMSPAKDQEYFSDGMAEEIINSLANVAGLKVAGRTSSFSFKGKTADLKVIGETLGVAHILEGSVRRQGERVRITAQLVRANDGFHVWSDTYDGTLIRLARRLSSGACSRPGCV